MFQLIIAVISIALISALAIASIFYGGNAFNKGNVQSAVSTLINGGQQIAGAQAMYRTDYLGANGDNSKLVSGSYLSQVPAVSAISPTGALWTVPAATTAATSFASVALNATGHIAACNEIETQAGRAVASATAYTVPTDVVGQFGCYGTATAPRFGFKY